MTYAKNISKYFSVDVPQWQDQHADLINELEAYKGNNQFILNMYHELTYWGTLSDNQVKKLRVAFKQHKGKS